MNLTINGEPQASSAETLGALVESLGMKPDRVAIELNREIVPRDQPKWFWRGTMRTPGVARNPAVVISVTKVTPTMSQA